MATNKMLLYVFGLTNSHQNCNMQGKKLKIKNWFKTLFNKKRTALLRNITEKIEIDENYRDTVKFCYSDFNGNIKVRLHELYRGKYVHTIANFNKIETLVEKIINNES